MKIGIALLLLLAWIIAIVQFAKPASAGIDMDSQGNGSRNTIVANRRSIQARSPKPKIDPPKSDPPKSDPPKSDPPKSD